MVIIREAEDRIVIKDFMAIIGNRKSCFVTYKSKHGFADFEIDKTLCYFRNNLFFIQKDTFLFSVKSIALSITKDEEIGYSIKINGGNDGTLYIIF